MNYAWKVVGVPEPVVHHVANHESCARPRRAHASETSPNPFRDGGALNTIGQDSGFRTWNPGVTTTPARIHPLGTRYDNWRRDLLSDPCIVTRFNTDRPHRHSDYRPEPFARRQRIKLGGVP